MLADPSPHARLRTTFGDLRLSEPVTLKLEALQHAGSFKARLSLNTALGLGVKAEIFVPGVSSRAKIDRLRAQGALVNILGELYDDAQEVCDARAASIEALKIHSYNAPLMVAGKATLGVELVEQVPGLDTVLATVRGGGLAAGLRLALHSSVRVIAVETEACKAFHVSRAAREPVDVSPAGVGTDALGADRIGELPWSIRADTTESIVVDDTSVIAGRRDLWSQY